MEGEAAPQPDQRGGAFCGLRPLAIPNRLAQTEEDRQGRIRWGRRLVEERQDEAAEATCAFDGDDLLREALRDLALEGRGQDGLSERRGLPNGVGVHTDGEVAEGNPIGREISSRAAIYRKGIAEVDGERAAMSLEGEEEDARGGRGEEDAARGEAADGGARFGAQGLQGGAANAGGAEALRRARGQ